MSNQKTAVFIRMDKIGDLVLTLPCENLVAEEFNIHWLIPKGLDFIVESARPKKTFFSLSKLFSWNNFFALRKQLLTIRPQVSVSFHVPWWVNLCLWFCRVPTRGGVLSQWHSYLFLNKGLRQKRSRCEFHELEYNYILVEHTFSKKRNRDLWKPLEISASSDGKDQGPALNHPYVVVHPGMGGSALNWPNENYLQLISQLSQKIQVVITGTKSDAPYLEPLKQDLKSNANVLWLDSQLSGPQLLNVLATAIAIVAPSTGVLHLGTSLGAPSFGIYSPIQVHSPKRWGPMGINATPMTPHVQCPAQFECLGKECPHFECMGALSAKTVLESLPI